MLGQRRVVCAGHLLSRQDCAFATLTPRGWRNWAAKEGRRTDVGKLKKAICQICRRKTWVR